MEEDFEIEIHGTNPGIVFEVGPKKKMLVVREVAPQSEGALGGVMSGDFLIAVITYKFCHDLQIFLR